MLRARGGDSLGRGGRAGLLCCVVAVAGCGRIDFANQVLTDAAGLADGAGDGTAKTYANVILADRPVGYWRLGETSGLVARDASGHGFDGSYVGGTTIGQPGAIANDTDTAMTLDGTSGFVRIPHAAQLDDLTIATAEGWVRGGTAHGSQELWSAWDGGAGGWQLIYNNGVAGTWTNNGIVTAGVTITDTAWHHLVAVWDLPQGQIYVDGVLAGSGGVQLTPTAFDNQIGTQCQTANSTNCYYWLLGDVDEVAIYDRALTAADVARHYQAGLGVFP